MSEPPPEAPTAGATDAELARRVWESGGERAAEEELCRRLMPRIELYGLRHLRDPEAALELTQRVMLLTLTRLRAREVEAPERIASFALGTARNAARDLRREDARWRAAEALEADDPRVAHQPLEPVDHGRLGPCLAALPERERTVVLLSFHDRRTAPQIGAQLGLTGGNVRVIRLRALNRLRDCLGASGVAV